MLTRRTILKAGLAAPLCAAAPRAAQVCGPIQISDLDSWLGKFVLPPVTKVNSFVPLVQGLPAKRPVWSVLVKPENRAQLAKYQQDLETAYRKMIAFPPQNPRSLIYQVMLHWKVCPMDSGRPNIHATSAFLPWHRAYLFYFERLIQSLSSSDFRLAAWDWETNGAIPSVYNSPSLFPNFPSVCVLQRSVPSIYVDKTALIGWLQEPANSTAFLGSACENCGANSCANCAGLAAGFFHDYVHTQLGPPMSFINLAAFDPVFFAHHANIDRFWDYWYQQHKSDAAFFEGQTYPSAPWIFYDAIIDSHVSVKATDVLELGALKYEYNPPAKLPLYPKYALTATVDRNNILSFVPAEVEHLRSNFPGPGDFSLPTVVQVTVPDDVKSGNYTLHLHSHGKIIGEAGLSVLSHHHGPSSLAFGSLTSQALDSLLKTSDNQLSIDCTPRIQDLTIRSAELQYPATPDAWKLL